eukprot:763523-Hanusia_phi.AAC.2
MRRASLTCDKRAQMEKSVLGGGSLQIEKREDESGAYECTFGNAVARLQTPSPRSVPSILFPSPCQRLTCCHARKPLSEQSNGEQANFSRACWRGRGVTSLAATAVTCVAVLSSPLKSKVSLRHEHCLLKLNSTLSSLRSSPALLRSASTYRVLFARLFDLPFPLCLRPSPPPVCLHFRACFLLLVASPVHSDPFCFSVLVSLEESSPHCSFRSLNVRLLRAWVASSRLSPPLLILLAGTRQRHQTAGGIGTRSLHDLSVDPEAESGQAS